MDLDRWFVRKITWTRTITIIQNLQDVIGVLFMYKSGRWMSRPTENTFYLREIQYEYVVLLHLGMEYYHQRAARRAASLPDIANMETSYAQVLFWKYAYY